MTKYYLTPAVATYSPLHHQIYYWCFKFWIIDQAKTRPTNYDTMQAYRLGDDSGNVVNLAMEKVPLYSTYP